MVDHVIGVNGFSIVRPFVRNESNVREPIPPLQLGADGPESLCLLLRKGGMPYQNSIVSQPIKRDAGRNDSIAVLDEHVLGSRKDHTDFSILLADILYVIGHERLRRALVDFRLVVRIEQHRSVGVGRRNMRNPWTNTDRQSTGLMATGSLDCSNPSCGRVTANAVSRSRSFRMTCAPAISAVLSHGTNRRPLGLI